MKLAHRDQEIERLINRYHELKRLRKKAKALKERNLIKQIRLCEIEYPKLVREVRRAEGDVGLEGEKRGSGYDPQYFWKSQFAGLKLL